MFWGYSDLTTVLNAIYAKTGLITFHQSEATCNGFEEEDFIDDPEERRLFYVAITRTKNKVYLVVPEKVVDRTPYVDEVENIQNEYEKYQKE